MARQRASRAISDYAKQVGERIVQARMEQGAMTQVELAELIHVSQRAMQAYENGEVLPYRKIDDLSDVLGKSVPWILHGEDAEADGNETRRLLKELIDTNKAILEEVREWARGQVPPT